MMDGASCRPVRPQRLITIPLSLPPSAQVHWVLCVQESVLNSVVDRLRLRMSGMKCVALNSDKDRALVDAAVQEAQQQGATVSRNPKENWGDVQNECLAGGSSQSDCNLRPFLLFSFLSLVPSWFSPAQSHLQVPSTLPQCSVGQPPPLHLW